MRNTLFVVFMLCSTVAAAAPEIQHWLSGNGVRIYFVETRQLPIVDLQLVFDAGSVRDPAGKRGLSLITSSLLNQAAGGLTADEISFEFERLGAEFSTSSAYDSVTVSLRSLSDPEKLKPALATLQKVLSVPEFRGEDLQRQRRRLLVSIQKKQQSPGTVAREAFQRAIYRQHPYAFPNEGTPETLAEIEREDVADFHARYYTAANAIISIVGDLDRSEAEKLAGQIAHTLPDGIKPSETFRVDPVPSGELIKIDHPSTQVHIITGQPGIRYGDPDYFPLVVGNHILGGGGLVSRLFSEVREKRGLSYGAGSAFSPRRDPGPFLASIQTRADQADAALVVVHDTIAEFTEHGPTAEEVKSAKQNITGGFPLRIDSNRKISGYISVIGFYGLPLDYLDTFNSRIETVTAEDIHEAFQRRIYPDRLVTIMAGPVGNGHGQETD